MPASVVMRISRRLTLIPETIAALQHAVRDTNGSAQEKYDEYSRMVNEHAARKATLRGLLNIRTEGATAIPLEQPA